MRATVKWRTRPALAPRDRYLGRCPVAARLEDRRPAGDMPMVHDLADQGIRRQFRRHHPRADAGATRGGGTADLRHDDPELRDSHRNFPVRREIQGVDPHRLLHDGGSDDPLDRPARSVNARRARGVSDGAVKKSGLTARRGSPGRSLQAAVAPQRGPPAGPCAQRETGRTIPA